LTVTDGVGRHAKIIGDAKSRLNTRRSNALLLAQPNVPKVVPPAQLAKLNTVVVHQQMLSEN